MEGHVGTEYDFPPRLEHLIELLSEGLADDGQLTRPDGAPQLGLALAIVLLHQVQIGMAVLETTLADLRPDPKQLAAGLFLEHRTHGIRHPAQGINLALSTGIAGCGGHV